MLEIAEFLQTRNRFAPWHTDRYMQSLEWITDFLLPKRMVLDLGGRSPFRDALLKFYDVQLRSEVPDLRYGFPYQDEMFDLVLCMEVLEHVSDRGDSRVDVYTGSGLKNVIVESMRVLKPGGNLFCTTPNVNSYNSVMRIISGKHPFSYDSHFRELSQDDLRSFVEGIGFTVMRVAVEDCWEHHEVPGRAIKAIDKFTDKLLGSEVDRGDCIFLLASKI